MSWLLLLQWRNDFFTDVLGFPAAGMEVTAARWIDRAGHISLQDDAFALIFHVWIGYRDG